MGITIITTIIIISHNSMKECCPFDYWAGNNENSLNPLTSDVCGLEGKDGNCWGWEGSGWQTVKGVSFL